MTVWTAKLICISIMVPVSNGLPSGTFKSAWLFRFLSPHMDFMLCDDGAF